MGFLFQSIVDNREIGCEEWINEYYSVIEKRLKEFNSFDQKKNYLDYENEKMMMWYKYELEESNNPNKSEYFRQNRWPIVKKCYDRVLNFLKNKYDWINNSAEINKENDPIDNKQNIVKKDVGTKTQEQSTIDHHTETEEELPSEFTKYFICSNDKFILKFPIIQLAKIIIDLIEQNKLSINNDRNLITKTVMKMFLYKGGKDLKRKSFLSSLSTASNSRDKELKPWINPEKLGEYVNIILKEKDSQKVIGILKKE